MKSDNPHSGIYKADTSRSLDLNGGNPSCNQGGMLVVGIDTYNQTALEEKSPTLRTPIGGDNTAKVVYGVDTYNNAVTGEKAMTMSGAASDSHHIPCVMGGS